MGGTEDSGATILQFPVVRREPPTIEAMTALAPPRSLVASLVADAGFEARDALRGFDREFDYLVRAIEMGSGPDDAIIRLRHLMDTHLVHAMELCQAFQAAGDRLVKIEVQVAQSEKLGGSGQMMLPRARREFRDRAIAARVAADAALGAAQALAGHVRRAAGLAVAAAEEPQQLQLFAAAG